MPDVKMWGAQLWLLVAALFLLSLAVVTLVFVWTLLRAGRSRRGAERAEAARRAGRFGPDGRPLPPTARGLCDRCGRVHDEIRFLADGRRLCPGCSAVETDSGDRYDSEDKRPEGKSHTDRGPT